MENPRSHCLLCKSNAVELFLDLGETALANKFLSQVELSETEPKFPLRVGYCHECGHVQLTEIVPPRAMFEDYLYVSSASDTLKTHLFDLSDVVVSRYKLGKEDLVVDIGCNDGTLLKGFRRHGVKTLGVDPAANLAELESHSDIARYVGFFNSATAREIVSRWGNASAITMTNTFPHIPELQDFVEGIKLVLAPKGVFVIEAHYLLDILEQCAFDTVYHEHVSYWALGPMKHLFERNGLEIVNAERLPIHHGQLRVSVQHRGEGKIQPEVSRLLGLEQAAGIDRFETFERFSQKAFQIKLDLHRMLNELRNQNKQVVAYGAPAKGNTLLSFLEIRSNTVSYIADRSPLKQGRFTPGTHIPVVSPDRLLTDKPDYVLLLAWNFADEVLHQQSEYRKLGGQFIIPIPEIRII
jgi:hypothetical protein